MADAPLNQLSSVGIDQPTLGYRTNTSPVDESPHWVFGSVNTMATIRGEVEKRPGFSLAVETAITAIPGIVRRLFTWRRFSRIILRYGFGQGRRLSPARYRRFGN